MPTNLPPEYFDAEERFREADTPTEKIACLEDLIATVPKHKGTDHLRADLRRKLSKLKENLEAAKKSGKRSASVFSVEKEGAGRVAVIGAPNVGKSALLNAVTHATPKVSEYPFTTWIPTPGMMPVMDIQIQLIDTPALSKEHIEPELFNLIRSCEMALLLVDLQGHPLQELDDAVEVLTSHRTPLCCSKDEVPKDVHPAPTPCLVLVNKCDDDSWFDEFAVFSELLEDRWPLLSISAKTGHNLDRLKQTVYERLDIIRVYSKQPSKPADMTAPFVLPRGGTVDEFAAKVHKDFVEHLKTARIWGPGVHDGQPVGREHVLKDGNIVELHM
jgi:ribosome-interacting GTPase 1